jgi:hypothetical protein
MSRRTRRAGFLARVKDRGRAFVSRRVVEHYAGHPAAPALGALVVGVTFLAVALGALLAGAVA